MLQLADALTNDLLSSGALLLLENKLYEAKRDCIEAITSPTAVKSRIRWCRYSSSRDIR